MIPVSLNKEKNHPLYLFVLCPDDRNNKTTCTDIQQTETETITDASFGNLGLF